MERAKAVTTTLTGIVGGGIASIFGGWDTGLKVLITVMSVDYITGLMVAGLFQKSTKTETGALKSLEGWKGICRKGMTLLIVLLSYLLDTVAGTDFIRDAVIIAYTVNEMISITENAGQMGVPLPPAITKGIDILREKGEK